MPARPPEYTKEILLLLQAPPDECPAPLGTLREFAICIIEVYVDEYKNEGRIISMAVFYAWRANGKTTY